MKEDWRGREKKSDLKKNNNADVEIYGCLMMTSLIVIMLEYGIQELQVQSYK